MGISDEIIDLLTQENNFCKKEKAKPPPFQKFSSRTKTKIAKSYDNPIFFKYKSNQLPSLPTRRYSDITVYWIDALTKEL